MRTLLSYLLAQQKKKTRRPYLRVRIYDQVGGIARLHFTALYTGAEAAGPHAMHVNGSYFNRLRVDPATNILYSSRTAPGPTWASLRTTTVRCAQSCYGNNLIAFAVDSGTPTRIHYATSDDLGLSWSAWTLLVTAAGTVAHLAAASKTNGDTVLVYAVGATVYRIKRTSAVWGSAAAWTNTVASVTGLAVQYWLDFNLVITGTEATTLNPTAWSCIYGDGYSEAVGAWTVLRVMTQAAAGTTIAYSVPSVLYHETFRANYRHTFGGSTPYDRIDFTASPIAADYVDNLWTEPHPFAVDNDYGLQLSYNDTYIFAATANTIYRAPFPTALDVSADVLSCVAHDYPLDPRGVTLRLRNHDGRYNSPGVGALINLSRGARVDIGPGYYVPHYGANMASSGPSYYIDTIGHIVAAGRRDLVLHAGSAWHLLARWRPGRPYQWTAGSRNYFQLFSLLLAKMGLELSALSSSTKMTDDYPDFAVTPGYNTELTHTGWRTWIDDKGIEHITPVWSSPAGYQQIAAPTALSAIALLFSHLEDRPLVREDLVYAKRPLAADASDYAFGTDHPIITATYRQVATDNRFLAFGDADLTAEAVDYVGVDLLHDRPRVVHDKGMTTAADVAGRAAREARDAAIFSREDTIVVPPHCGLELLDVVTITDVTLGLAAVKRRVIGITLVFDRVARRPRYYQIVTLGDP